MSKSWCRKCFPIQLESIVFIPDKTGCSFRCFEVKYVIDYPQRYGKIVAYELAYGHALEEDPVIVLTLSRWQKLAQCFRV